MRPTLCVVILSISVGLCLAQQQGTSLDDLVKQIFTTSRTIDPKDIQPIPTQPPPTIVNPPPTQQEHRSCGFERECVPRFLCKNGTINTEGIDIIDIRLSGADCDYLEECCDIPNKTSEPVIEIQHPHEGCGFQNPDGVGFKIVGDQSNETQFGEFPWMVAILREEEAADEILNLYECGGALIAPTVIITAAHCVQTKNANTLIVRAGEWDTQTKNEILPYQDRRVREIIVHENYHKGALYHDIALLILQSPFEWQENIRPICLPDSNAVFDFSRCYATGWGKDKFGREGTYQVILKKIDLPVVPREQCQLNLRSTRLGKYFQLHPSFICAGGERDKDTCKGDGGSPLVCPDPDVKNRYYQAGIVAWGIGCGEENIPGVYSNVPYLRQWINEKLSFQNIDFKYFTV